MLIFVMMGLAVLLVPLAVVALSGRQESTRYRAPQPDNIPASKASSNDISMDPDRRRRLGVGDD
ncbi:hypothetical protein EDE15_0218 [Edaphobacter aggregans]|uniref:Uncharacterized protein n=1 Tax=Edaphobacter aggregans TaxID=570835 RepID=A0A428MCV8_9BACT|nr:hypothetical protein [Edaphobacter aggregans]RSL14753.1 hypothetical protein EDE15_0218 [Edaphobacter aggregans]